ncbi:MAG: ChbG/HpnK family deacetylase [Myxococcota bacterium]|nr:ChbG/HpnK family deacetylase [Myxococcota bacterium]
MDRKLLILNADDLGYDPAVTRGIIESMRQGVVTSTTLMVNLEDSQSAAQAGAGLAIGLHLNLARGAPVSAGFPASLLQDGQLVEARAGELPGEVVLPEVLAQLDRLEALTGRPATHLDVHKHLHQHPGILEGLIEAARGRGLPVRAITPTMRQTLRAGKVRTTDHFIGDAGKTAYWTLEQLEADLAGLQPGTTELMCHPGYAPQTLKSGYSAQREVELATFLHPRARVLLEQAGVELADFGRLP